ncbi:class I SAM-dependent methyltransferase [Candidatus Omnitrophota bacterium]
MKKPSLDIRAVLQNAQFYRLLRRIVGSQRVNFAFVEKYVRPKNGDKILDIGCGPGDILECLPDNINYYGFDMSQKYINAARRRFGNRGSFVCKRLSPEAVGQLATYDIVIASGIMHHLNDDEAIQLLELARAALKPSGRLITRDGCYADGQHKIARYILSKDRGRYVRTMADYKNLASRMFPSVRADLHHDLSRLPYTHIFMECIQRGKS